MADVTLTEAEREALIVAFLDPDDDCAHNMAPVWVAVERILAERIREAADKAKVEALRAFADTRGINVGEDDDEWWRGYRQAQRECLHDAISSADNLDGGEEVSVRG